MLGFHRDWGNSDRLHRGYHFDMVGDRIRKLAHAGD